MLLFSLCINGHTHIVDFLISEYTSGKRDNMADVHFTDVHGTDGLLAAAERAHKHVVESIITKTDVDVNHSDTDGDTPLLVAAFGGHLPTFKIIFNHPKINRNATNDRGSNAFHYAAGRKNLIRCRISSGSARCRRLCCRHQ